MSKQMNIETVKNRIIVAINYLDDWMEDHGKGNEKTHKAIDQLLQKLRQGDLNENMIDELTLEEKGILFDALWRRKTICKLEDGSRWNVTSLGLMNHVLSSMTLESESQDKSQEKQ